MAEVLPCVLYGPRDRKPDSRHVTLGTTEGSTCGIKTAIFMLG